MKSFLNISIVVSALASVTQSIPLSSGMLQQSLFQPLQWTFDSIFDEPPKGKKSILDTIVWDPQFKRLADIVLNDDGLKKILENPDAQLTLFAPINEAFIHYDDHPHGKEPSKEDIYNWIVYHTLPDALSSKKIAKSHVLGTQLNSPELNDQPTPVRIGHWKGDTYINFSKVTKADIHATNGVVHAINHVLIPPPSIFDGLHLIPTGFSTLTSAIHVSGYGGDFEGFKGVTVFAPTNRAFRKLGYKNLAELFAPDNRDTLRKLVEYHVSSELVYTNEIFKNRGNHAALRIPTNLGDGYELDIKGESAKGGQYKITVNNARVLVYDGIAKNGVVHVVDTVLVPPHHDENVRRLLTEVEDESLWADEQTVNDHFNSLPKNWYM
ncbi:Fasciclin-domain-containing protein [Basidiobolus meristosporus CBS 931.73]|uniref:Fasciclin-domain-containing protein n=1 Tax=Basidiobolus meristosporus CBS 931.73 TaxID=1314790 RepID=A0A1Y1Z9U8_9FUNG|nr:Fasciclin-domain-containing protein [Basidiobolus meristosporus CBS 931.73]|eukprot:ORY07063.1 Fasciclin-domain-containing protein [Basidiobolus meristosporus CBS 931.73]